MLKARKLVDAFGMHVIFKFKFIVMFLPFKVIKGVGFAVLVYRSAHTMYLYRYIVANYGYNERYT